MQMSIFGTGYVGLVTGVCFAEMGNDVLCADIDQTKIDQLRQGLSPIYEPGLEDLIKSNIEARRLSFTTDLTQAVHQSELLFVAVGTPSDENGSADLKVVLEVAAHIGRVMNESKTVVMKSTVPVGTCAQVRDLIRGELRARGVDHHVEIVSNPEFLREGTAIRDCLTPARVVVGVESPRSAELMKRLYQPFLKGGNPLLVMDCPSSEMTKYAANCMLAARISLMNEFAKLCDQVGADVEMVRRGVGSDHRLGPFFMYPGIGYGGSCFPKDVKAAIRIGDSAGVEMKILKAVESVNQGQRDYYFEKLRRLLGKDLKNRKVAVWGLSFKPGTDDIREAPALDLVARLLREGAQVQAHDPIAMPHVREVFKGSQGLHLFEHQYEALQEADLLCVVTEWKPFKEPNFKKMKELMKAPRILDGRNLYDPAHLRELGFEYLAIGRGQRS